MGVSIYGNNYEGGYSLTSTVIVTYCYSNEIMDVGTRLWYMLRQVYDIFKC